MTDADQQKIYQEIKQEVDRIRTFPEDAEDPQVSLATQSSGGAQPADFTATPRKWPCAKRPSRSGTGCCRIPESPRSTCPGARDLEIQVDVPQERLRAYGLTLDRIAQSINTASTEIPGGSVETGRRRHPACGSQTAVTGRREFARIPIISTADGTVVFLEDIATVRESFEDSDRSATYNGQRSIGLDVFRVGDQTPIGVSRAVREAMARDRSGPARRYRLGHQPRPVRNLRAAPGPAAEKRLHGPDPGAAAARACFSSSDSPSGSPWAFRPSFLGGLLFLPVMGVSINIISMFAFIVALGIVVDDAIVAGENIYEYRQQGHSYAKAAVIGARTVMPSRSPSRF